ncbi:unnamed protein product [Pedinophyceae sp. YPF-701]|nr:unnamed protein product [Pedinophyceae sp. YPF-701]
MSLLTVLAVAGFFGAAFALGSLYTKHLLNKRYQYDKVIKLSADNDRLRTKIEELRVIAGVLEPKTNEELDDLFVPGINKEVIIGRVDKLLENQDVNIRFIPDFIERQVYVNAISLMLSILNDVLKSMSIEFAGHRVKFALTFLDVADFPTKKSKGGRRMKRLSLKRLTGGGKKDKPAEPKKDESQDGTGGGNGNAQLPQPA